MSSKMAIEYPNIPSVLAIVGGALIALIDIFPLAVSIVVLPHLNYTNFMSPRGSTGSPGALATGFFGAGRFIVGSVLGIVVGIMTLRWKPPTGMISQ